MSTPAAAIARPSSARVWLHAARPRTLGASLVPVAVGSAAATELGDFHLWVFLLCAGVALLLQVATNLANDALDFMGGVDTRERRGPLRVTQAGWLDPASVLRAAIACLALAALLAIALVLRGGWPILLIGAISLLAAYAYSAGPVPLSSLGLGELAAFVFFGLVAVTGTAYLHTLGWSPFALIASVPIAALVTALMAVNNLRDIQTDRASGKRTLAVRMGAPATRALFAGLVVLAFAAAPALLLEPRTSVAVLLPLLALPLAVALVQKLVKARTGDEFNLALVSTARLHALYGLLLVAGILL